MKFKFFLLSILSIFLYLIIKQQEILIKVPKEDRRLIQVNEKVVKGKIVKFDDGDSFTLEDATKIRLFAIDAPELDQICTLTNEITDKENNTILKEDEVKCGEDAKNKLLNLVGNREVVCLIRGKDAFERLVGDCSFEITNRKTKQKNKININKEMVLSGYAVAFVQISDKYIEDENKAKSENRGIWSTQFITPAMYRKKKY